MQTLKGIGILRLSPANGLSSRWSPLCLVLPALLQYLDTTVFSCSSTNTLSATHRRFRSLSRSQHHKHVLKQLGDTRMPQLGSRKSRRGCLQCKQRRVKCDEDIPCGACLRRKEACSFLAPEPRGSVLDPTIPANSEEWTHDLYV